MTKPVNPPLSPKARDAEREVVIDVVRKDMRIQFAGGDHVLCPIDPVKVKRAAERLEHERDACWHSIRIVR